MTSRDLHSTAHSGEGLLSYLWYAVALICCLYVAVLNTLPLFYFDSVGYYLKGTNVLKMLGVLDPAASTAGGAGGGLGGAGGTEKAGIDGSHSVWYSLVLAIFAGFASLKLVPLVNALLVLLTSALVVRVVSRVHGYGLNLPFAASFPIIVSAVSSLPFYVAFLMPDILTPLLLLVVALLTGYVRQMRWGEILLALAIGTMAGVFHISHLPILALLLPLSALGALVVELRRWWLAPLLVGIMLVLGVAEKSAFTIGVQEVTNEKVVYKPFITVRLIEDGPAYRFMERACPDDSIPTCALYEALQWSDDPYRLTASHILLEESPRLGSFLLMTPEDQRAVAEDQIPFFFRVLLSDPLGTSYAFLQNTWLQAMGFSVWMTLPHDDIITRAHGYGGDIVTLFVHGTLSADKSWLPAVERVHEVVYALSLLVIVYHLLRPAPFSAPILVLVAMVFLGILVNAFVCGGVSQPAARYGARVIWLLPYLAALLSLVRFAWLDRARDLQ
ncbi:hypothetical protein AB0T83_10505 [Fluviibacterium sp. DFM31]|uniref:Glycosyltransferase RgtA/B/C/D-like domain-containing protein n=1 Tax=Meridianimarinicoccus marinus TaxID=3231483 RepID=A0ABV3L6K9_9RHOB